MSLTPDALQALLLDSRELALLDVREARQAFGPHPALARHAPLSGLELQIPAFVPRRATPVVVYDADDSETGAAARAQSLLRSLGWTDVRRLAGGLAAWVARGLPTIDGYGALIKAFGDLARQHYGTPTLSLDELEARQRAGLPTTLIDARPAAEYAFLSIAGARNHPGTELALRQLPAQGPGHLLAVNCFSRTRGIIGATTLRLLGLDEQAVFVEDGVMAWGLRGSPVVQNARPADDLPRAPEAELRQRADALVSRHGLVRIDAERLARLRADRSRSLYLFDLRLAGEHGPAAGARRVAGGQLLMHFENLVGTRGARVVLIDERHGLRAAVTAFWLTQFNQAEIFVLDGPAPAPADAPAEPAPADERAIDPGTLAGLIDNGAAVIDVAASLDYEAGHLPGAFFLLPASLAPADPLLASGRTVVFTSSDGAAARLAARDAQVRVPGAVVGWLRGGTTGWKAAGGIVEQDWATDRLLTPFDDDFGSVMRVLGSRRDRAWRDYLAWERGVAARVVRDPAVRFRFF